MTKTKKGLLILAFIVTITVFGYWWLLSKDLNDVRITTLGDHHISASECIKSVTVADIGTQFEVKVSYTSDVKRRFSWNPLTQIGTPDWNPFTKGYYLESFSYDTMLVDKADNWEIRINQ